MATPTPEKLATDRRNLTPTPSPDPRIARPETSGEATANAIGQKGKGVTKIIYVHVDILNIRVGALLDSGCSDNFISRTTADQLGHTMYPMKTAI